MQRVSGIRMGRQSSYSVMYGTSRIRKNGLQLQLKCEVRHQRNFSITKNSKNCNRLPGEAVDFSVIKGVQEIWAISDKSDVAMYNSLLGWKDRLNDPLRFSQLPLPSFPFEIQNTLQNIKISSALSLLKLCAVWKEAKYNLIVQSHCHRAFCSPLRQGKTHSFSQNVLDRLREGCVPRSGQLIFLCQTAFGTLSAEKGRVNT